MDVSLVPVDCISEAYLENGDFGGSPFLADHNQANLLNRRSTFHRPRSDAYGLENVKNKSGHRANAVNSRNRYCDSAPQHHSRRPPRFCSHSQQGYLGCGAVELQAVFSAYIEAIFCC